MLVKLLRLEVASVRVSIACLVNPLEATLWLDNKMAELGSPSEEKRYCFTGALGLMVEVQTGNSVMIEINGVGKVTTRFSM